MNHLFFLLAISSLSFTVKAINEPICESPNEPTRTHLLKETRWIPPYHSLLRRHLFDALPLGIHPSNATHSHSLHKKAALSMFPHWYGELYASVENSAANKKPLETEVEQSFRNLRGKSQKALEIGIDLASTDLSFPNFKISEDFKRGFSYLSSKAQEVWVNGNGKGRGKAPNSLEIGDGIGRSVTIRPKSCYYRILCIDPYGEIRREVESVGLTLSNFEFIEDLEVIPFDDASFDAVLRKTFSRTKRSE